MQLFFSLLPQPHTSFLPFPTATTALSAVGVIPRLVRDCCRSSLLSSFFLRSHHFSCKASGFHSCVCLHCSVKQGSWGPLSQCPFGWTDAASLSTVCSAVHEPGGAVSVLRGISPRVSLHPICWHQKCQGNEKHIPLCQVVADVQLQQRRNQEHRACV